MEMKRIVALGAVLTILSCMSTGAAAQMKWEIGVKGGVTLADLRGDDAFVHRYDGSKAGDWGGRFGFGGGAFATVNANDCVAFQIEVLFVQKGAEASLADSLFVSKSVRFFDGDIEFTHSYIEIPMLAVFSRRTTDRMTLSALAGPVVAFNLSSKLGFEGTIGGTSVDEKFDIENVKSVDVGAAIGLGGAVDVGQVVIVFDGRWTLGLVSTDDSDSDLDLKNSSLAFMAGIAFPLE
jgi:hypothetical protein